jgi:hypothetical protein
MLDQVPTRVGQRLTRDQLAALLSQLDGSEATAERACEGLLAYFKTQVTDAGDVVTAQILAEARRLCNLDLPYARHFIADGIGLIEEGLQHGLDGATA